MLTLERLRVEMSSSATREEHIYQEMSTVLFRELQDPLKLLYDETIRATANLTSITPEVIQASPRIIKILRYGLAPVISQMRLGQIIGLGTTEVFEEQGRTPDPNQATSLARWIATNLDRERFPWTAGPVSWSASERAVAEQYAKLWTVSLLSNQSTATRYRNQRKERQEQAISGNLNGMGLTLQRKLSPAPHGQKRPSSGGINWVGDVATRSYVKEKKILAGSEKKQKADLTVRPSEAERLYCIEAKAVGIRIDSTKRLKELNDKFTDWTRSSLPITTIGVIAGFFNEIELVATIKKRGIPIFFEHDLAQLSAFLREGLYFGSPWSPRDLFADVSDTDVEEAMENITTTPTEGGEPSVDASSAE